MVWTHPDFPFLVIEKTGPESISASMLDGNGRGSLARGGIIYFWDYQISLASKIVTVTVESLETFDQDKKKISFSIEEIPA
jgi:hypothetical protein